MDEKPVNTGTRRPQATDNEDAVAAAIRLGGRRETPPQDSYDRAFEAAAAALQNKIGARRRKRSRILGAAVAASFLLAVTAGVLLQPDLQNVHIQDPLADRVVGTVLLQQEHSSEWRPLIEGEVIPIGGRVRTHTAGGAGIVLKNGVSVRMASDSTLELVTATRLNMPAGKVYIDAGTEPGTGIELITPAGTARDIGTQFEVRYTNNQYRLRIRDGSVNLQTSDAQLSAASGEELNIDATGIVGYRRISGNDPEWNWAEQLAPTPELDGQPLTMLLQWVGRETGRKIVFASPELEDRAATIVLHGTVSRMNPLETLGAMLSTTDLRYRLLEDGTILIHADE